MLSNQDKFSTAPVGDGKGLLELENQSVLWATGSGRGMPCESGFDNEEGC